MAGLDEKFRSMIDEQMNICEELKPIERRMTVLKKHIGQADTSLKYKGKKAWKKEYADLTAKRQVLNERYVSLKDEVKEAEQIRP